MSGDEPSQGQEHRAATTAAHTPGRQPIGPDASGAYAFGDWTLRYDPPPIPLRSMDWEFVHRDYDASWEGEEDGYRSNGLSGRRGSLFDCIVEIEELEAEHPHLAGNVQ